MICPVDTADVREFLRRWQGELCRGCVPLKGSIELTRRCNLRCVHCYLGPVTTGQNRERPEMTTAEFRSILGQIAQAGCLFLLVTGGEPLLRTDFPEVYAHARRLGMVVTVFTNGTLVDERIAKVFRELPPHAVEITLYGASRETYERITGVGGSYSRCLAGIHRLKEAGVRFGLKTILMTPNQHEFEAIKRMAEDLGARFRWDPAIFARMDGGSGPVHLRVSPSDVVAKDRVDPGRMREWMDLVDRFRDVESGDGLYRCGAGRNYFNIDPYGRLTPCLMLQSPSFDLKKGGFEEGWRQIGPELRRKRPSTRHRCQDCKLAVLCGHCPPFSLLESGDEQGHVPYLCEIARLRAEAIDECRETMGDARERGAAQEAP